MPLAVYSYLSFIYIKTTVDTHTPLYHVGVLNYVHPGDPEHIAGRNVFQIAVLLYHTL